MTSAVWCTGSSSQARPSFEFAMMSPENRLLPWMTPVPSGVPSAPES